MRKLYFQKLVRGIKYVLIFLAVYILGANVLVTLANFFKEYPFIQMLVLLGIPAVIVFFMASSKRAKDRDKGKAYKAALGFQAGNLKAEIGYILKSADYRTELLAGVTYILLFIAFTLLSGGFANFAFRLLYDLAMGAVIAAVFALCDLLSWLYVQRKFRKDELL
ncbi:MAG: hypothetical protein IJW00_02350 [Clostridia bacterium]|nr:hypothetical protein [Clostridia bacterium]